MRAIRRRLTYANVTATIALFVALGGTSYALSLPRDSVGSSQLRASSVGRSEIRTSAVRSAELRNRTIRLRDISASARQALQGQTGPAGPPGPTFFETINSAGGLVRGNATGSQAVGVNGAAVSFIRSMAACVPAATLTSAPGGSNPTAPPGASIRARVDSAGRVLVETWSPMETATPYPFNLVVAC